MLKSNSPTYRVKDLLLDESFQRNVSEGGGDTVAGGSMLTQNDGGDAIRERARSMLEKLRKCLEGEVTEEEQSMIWQRIEASIASSTDTHHEDYN